MTSEPSLWIESSALRVCVRPDVGGKIAQIIDRRSENALLVPAQKPYATIPSDACWLDYDLSGMDDCFPNIAPGPHLDSSRGMLNLPDHGEWVQNSWALQSVSPSSVHLWRKGSLLPYSAHKSIRLIDEDTIKIDYQLHNNDSSPFEYLWAAHPLILVNEPDYQLTLPEGTKQARTLTDDIPFEWPNLNGTDLSCQWIATGRFLKIFILDLTQGWCELRTQHTTLRFEFDLADTPKLGIWFNNLGFPSPPQNAYRCIAIEPCTTASDALGSQAVDALPSLAAGETKTWTLTLKIGTPYENHEC